MVHNELQSLINKTKEEIYSEFGFEFNHYPSNVWSYILKTNWMGMKTILIFCFENGKVKTVKTEKTFR